MLLFAYLYIGVPDRKAHPALFQWYCFLSTFTDAVKATWSERKPTGTAAATKKDDADDLFGDDDEDDNKMKELAAKKKGEAAAKKKPAIVARSIIVFDVKVVI